MEENILKRLEGWGIKLKNKKGRKLFRIMLKELSIFIVVSFVLIILVSVIFVYSSFFSKQKFFKEPFSINKTWFKSGEFSKLDIEKEYGEGSQFYVFNDEFNMVYQSENAIDYPYSKEETMLIPDELDDLSMRWVTGEQNKRLCKIEYINVNNDIKTIVIVDDQKNVVYSNKGIKGKMEEDAFDCLYGDNGEYELIKQSFQVSDKNYVAVFMFPLSLDHLLFKEEQRILLAVIVIVILGYVLSLYFYLRRLNKKVIQPMELLEEKMLKFSVADDSTLVKYEGPIEFEIIFERFHEMGSRLKLAQDRNRKMIADISHDLKTPISVIQLYSKLVNEEVITDAEKEEMMEKIVEKTNELSQLINLFSDYSKLYHSDFSMKFESCNFVEYSREYLISKYNELDLLGCRLEVDLPENVLMTSIDKMHFKRIFENIIGNSVKYNNRGVTIFFSLYKENEHIVIHIGDNGVGINDVIRDSVFEAFEIGDEARTTESGTGLGMAIVREIVILHGGSVRLLSKDESELSVLVEIKMPLK